uniref:G-protein coupled receptors family 1 profile domain-containing protein n=1 Tax=Neolamprologus brichardi TaxID=32507 RepID=A0A3Q4I112_NEOBR
MAQFNSTMVTSKISSSPGDSPHPSLDSSGLVPAVVMSICFLMGFPGNVAVIILKPNWENMSSLSQSLMLSLAVSDLLCLVTLPLWIYSYLYGWTFRLVGCKIITYFVYCSLYTSLLTLTVLSVQRYLQVVHLQRSLNRVRAKMLLLPLWLASMILSTPALVFRQLSEDQRWTTCSNQYSFEGGWMAKRMAVVMSETLVGFVSLSVIVFSYINLYRKVSRAVLFNNPQTTRLITSITRSLNQVRARKLLVPLWLSAMTLSTPALLAQQLLEVDQQRTYCRPQYSSEGQRMAVLLTEALVGFVSLSIIVFSYISLYRKVNRAAFFNNPQTTRLITSIIVTFVVLWVPYFVIDVLGVAAISLKNEALLTFCEDSWITAGALTFVNGAVNPLLYAFTSDRLSKIIAQNLPESRDITAEPAS